VKSKIISATVVGAIITFGFAVKLSAQDDILGPPIPPPKGHICHIANTAFMVEIGSKKILFDAMLDDGLPTYGKPSQSDQLAIEWGQKPFDGVDLVFSSHRHGDHFSPIATLRHMQMNTAARYIMTPEAEEELRALAAPGYDPDRIVNGPVPTGQSAIYELDGMDVRLFGISHGDNAGNPTQNLGLMVTVEGTSFFHPGDMSSDLILLQSAGLDGLKVDYLMMPYWYLMGDGRREVVSAAWDFKHIIPMHVPVDEQNWMEDYGGLEGVTDNVYDSFPGKLVKLDAGKSGQIKCLNLPLGY